MGILNNLKVAMGELHIQIKINELNTAITDQSYYPVYISASDTLWDKPSTFKFSTEKYKFK